ncbi:hypothetical protein HRbin40_00139 [bacterium HR40]|nr:hypothetical protein HRbin40_00139 [bacterium HR40]
MAPAAPVALEQAYRSARRRREPWEPLWRECFAYAAPVRGGGLHPAFAPANRLAEQLFDATAADAVEQLAASLLAELTPPWSRWFELIPGSAVSPEEQTLLVPLLERASRALHEHFEASNFAVELHQCFLDLVTVGTATLLFQEAPLGERSAFRFAAVPMAEVYLLGDRDGRPLRLFRTTAVTLGQIRARFPGCTLPEPLGERAVREPDAPVELVEAVEPDVQGVVYSAFLPADSTGTSPVLLTTGRFAHSPFLTFRWLKAAGEVYGRSPVMTALPDIKTANKVVELILKNASIAVTGIWLADDDGVLNPANIDLSPGSIIPKAPGSAGLTPLQAPGRFDVSQLVLEDLRARIRHTLLVDKLGPVASRRMTATEVLERSAEMNRLLGATYGRLKGELLAPLIERAVAILVRRGEIPDLPLDGRRVTIGWRSPLARAQAREDVQNILLWLQTIDGLGDVARAVADLPAAVRHLAESLGVPPELVRDPEPGGALAARAVLGDRPHDA